MVYNELGPRAGFSTSTGPGGLVVGLLWGTVGHPARGTRRAWGISLGSFGPS
jgi:hypothetical protein